jgi:hypothetical protein
MQDYETPLHIAVDFDHLAVVTLLLNCGANVNTKNIVSIDAC